MPEDVARAVGANGAATVEIAGKQCTVRPLSIRELTEVERDCVERYKRSYLKTFSDNLDLLPENMRLMAIREKMDEVSRWDVDDLPVKLTYDPSRLVISEKLKKWVCSEHEVKEDTSDFQIRNLAAISLDKGTLSDSEYEEMVGTKPTRMKIPYVSWWITGSFEGMISLVWICFRHNDVTRDEVIEELGKNPRMLSELSRRIDVLSTPQLGNG